jgi:hypothetical protein
VTQELVLCNDGNYRHRCEYVNEVTGRRCVITTFLSSEMPDERAYDGGPLFRPGMEHYGGHITKEDA